MSMEYGIVTIGTLSTNTSNYEAGYVFSANKKLKFHGFRVYPYAATSNVTCRLWDVASKTQLASVPLASTTVKTWNEVMLDVPVILEKGKSYAISYYSSPTRYRQTISDSIFNPLITLVSGCYTSSNGTYPSNADATYTHQLIDCIISDAYPGKYLIRSGSIIYTVTDGALTPLAETEITARLFQTYGVDDLPDGALLVGLTDPEVLYWQDSADALPIINLTVKGSPPVPQIVASGLYNLRHSTILGISHAAVVASTDVLFAISFDGGATWLAHSGVAWYIVDDQAAGMSAERFNSVTAEQWGEVVVLESYMVRFVLPNTTAFVSSVVLHYINP